MSLDDFYAMQDRIETAEQVEAEKLWRQMFGMGKPRLIVDFPVTRFYDPNGEYAARLQAELDRPVEPLAGRHTILGPYDFD